MSLPPTIPQLSTLPILLPSSFITQIQQTCCTPSDLCSLLSTHTPTIPPCKSLSIAKEEYFKSLLKKQPVQQLMCNLYTFMTENQYSVEQKTEGSNLVLRLVYLVSQIAMSKQKWKIVMNDGVQALGKRWVGEGNEHANYIAPYFTPYQCEQLLSYITQSILPFYEIWEKLLDQNQYFKIQAKLYQPVKIPSESIKLSQGKKLQVAQILQLQCLKEFIGDKPPVQEKKDPKKK